MDGLGGAALHVERRHGREVLDGVVTLHVERHRDYHMLSFTR